MCLLSGLLYGQASGSESLKRRRAFRQKQISPILSPATTSENGSSASQWIRKRVELSLARARILGTLKPDRPQLTAYFRDRFIRVTVRGPLLTATYAVPLRCKRFIGNDHNAVPLTAKRKLVTRRPYIALNKPY